MSRKPFFLIGCLLLVLLMVGTVSADVLTIYPTVNGRQYRSVSQESWASIVSGVGTHATSTATMYTPGCDSGTTSPNFTINRRFGMSYNTSGIPDTAIIDSAVIRIRSTSAAPAVTLGNFTLNIVGFSPDSYTSLAIADYDNYGTTAFSSYKTTNTNWTNNGDNNFTLNSDGINTINKTGFTGFGLKTGWDISGSFTGTWGSGRTGYLQIYGIAQTGTDYDPFLEVTYHLPDTTPPASITGLTNNTTVCESITWDWQGPGDADWNGTMIYKDSVLLYNVSNSTYSDTWAGLTGGVEYLFSSHTFDITGNVDPDWVNGTATPDACAIVPVADFIANDTEVCVDDPVMFNDTSTNTPTYWNWVMTPGGWDSHSESFVHAFDTAGSYNVSLEAGNAAGSDYENKTFYVNVTDCGLSADFTANLTCQIGIPMAVQFNSTCDELTIKNHWDFGDGNTTDDIQNPNNTYVGYGVYNVTHSCKDAGGPTIFENKTDYIVVGVNGTVCAANCTGSGSYCSGDADIEEPFNVMWLVFGLVGGLVILLIFSRR